MISECPCKDCQKRKVNCHARCEAYKEWKEEQQTQAADFRKQSQYDMLGSLHNRRILERYIKKKHRNKGRN